MEEELIETSAPKLTPQEKIEFEVAHILLKNEHFMSVQNKVPCVLSLLQGLTLIFWKMHENLTTGQLGDMN